MLHVTNGSVFLSRLHDLGLPGDIIPWDDILHEGPVPADLSDAALRRVRAEFLGEHWHDSDSIERSMTARDARLAAAAGGDEIVLWYEHDLYDQLHVLQVLDQLGRLGAALTAHVTAVLADDYLTAQPDDTLLVWFAARQPLSEEHWQAAAAAWKAFRAPDPVCREPNARRWVRSPMARCRCAPRSTSRTTRSRMPSSWVIWGGGLTFARWWPPRIR
jgi:hypothetical protein